MLDRLVKDIVSESASTYVSVLHHPEVAVSEPNSENSEPESDFPTAFDLSRFIPLLKERIHVINPFTRTFLVTWITLLDSIPDLELVFYLPAFLGGLFKFLSDPNRDVHVATQGLLEKILAEIKRIAQIKQGIEGSRKARSEGKLKRSVSSDSGSLNTNTEEKREHVETFEVDSDSATAKDGQDGSVDGDWVPGQDVQVDHPKILEILVNFLDSTSGKQSGWLCGRMAGLTNIKKKKSSSLRYGGLTAFSKSAQKTSCHLSRNYWPKCCQQWLVISRRFGKQQTRSTNL